jgi:hypothetical protein
MTQEGRLFEGLTRPLIYETTRESRSILAAVTVAFFTCAFDSELGNETEVTALCGIYIAARRPRSG